MKCNVGKTDKIIRIVLAIMGFGIGLAIPSWWALFGLIPLITGLTGFCPLYTLIGISTCKIEK